MLRQQPYKSVTPQFKGRIKHAYAKLSPDQQQEVDRRYERHLAACEKAGCAAEVMFLFEAIEELAAGRPLEAEGVRKPEGEIV